MKGKCPRCGNEDWIRLSDLPEYANYPIEFTYFRARCKKCGLEVVLYKCTNCGYRTPHVWINYEGVAKSKSDIMNTGELHAYKCLICGKIKIIREGGHFARMGR